MSLLQNVANTPAFRRYKWMDIGAVAVLGIAVGIAAVKPLQGLATGLEIDNKAPKTETCSKGLGLQASGCGACDPGNGGRGRYVLGGTLCVGC